MNIKQILAQPFHHFARGCRLHAFRSADGKYVLKTLTTEREIIDWFAGDGLRLTELPWAAKLGDTDTARCAALQVEGLRSAALAWTQLRADTAMIHLETTPSGDMHAAVDRGKAFPPFVPGREPFLLQHYAALVGPLLTARMAAGDEAAAREILDDIVDLLLRFAARGIASETLNFLNNCGCAGGRMVQIDVGEFTASRDTVLEQARTRRILTRKSFRRLQQRYPALADHFAARVDERFTAEAIETLWAQPRPTHSNR